jgi:DNA-binding CsgD family transcriptional regulator
MAGNAAKEIPLDQVEMYAGRGLTLAQICSCLGISEATLYNRKAKDRAIREAIKRGRAKSLLLVSNKLFEVAMKGDVRAIMCYLQRHDAAEDTELLKRIEALESYIEKQNSST